MSMQIQAQLYMVQLLSVNTTITSDVNISDFGENIVVYRPDGSIDVTNVDSLDETEQWRAVNAILNDIISDGYQLIPMGKRLNDGFFDGTIFFLSALWTTVGLTEINSSELGVSVSPNPAKEYINVEVDFKNQPSELVLISEQGYIYLKKDISNILSGQEFTLDISNVPAGKYLITVKDSKQYLTPKKLIVF